MKFTKESIKALQDLCCPDYYEENDNIVYLQNVKTNLLVRLYVMSNLQNLFIEIDSSHQGKANYMRENLLLNGWCWQSTSSMIPFFKDSDEILRGIAHVSSSRKLEHAWIRFTLMGEKYIFDPTINVLVPEKVYNEVFAPKVKGQVYSKAVKEQIIETFQSQEKNTDKYLEIPMDDFNINSPFYHGPVYAKGIATKEKVKKLSVYFDRGY